MFRKPRIYMPCHPVLRMLMLLIVTCIINCGQLYAQITSPENYYRLTTGSLADTVRIGELFVQANKAWLQDPDSAVILARKALKAAYGTRNNNIIARALLAVNTYYFNKKDYRQSKILLQEAIPYCIKAASENNKLLPYLYNSLAGICVMEEKTDSAVHYYFQCLSAIKRGKVKDSTLLITVYANLGGVLTQSEQLDQAMIYLNKAIPIAIQLNNVELLAQNYFNRGILYYIQEAGDSSIHYFKKANVYYKQLGKKESIGTVYAYMGGMKTKQGNVSEAKMYFDSSQKIDPGGAGQNIELQNGLANLYVKESNYHKAIPYYKRTIEIQHNRGASLYRTYYNLAECYSKTGDDQLAYGCLKIYTDLRDSLLNEDKIKTVDILEVKYRTAEKDKDITRKQLLLARQEISLKNKNNLVLSITGGATLCIGLLLGLYRRNKQKQTLQAEQLRNLQQEQKINMLHAQMEGIDLERKRLAQELHDGIGGMLAAVKMNFSILEQRHAALQYDPGYGETLRLLTDTAGEIRQTAHNLMPGLLTQQGLEAALRQYCDTINAGQQEVTIEFQAYGLSRSLNDELKRAVFLLIQELIQNVVKHARATYTLVQLSIQHDLMHVLVEDNGIGLPPKRAQGLGLGTLQDRIRQLGGQCTIDTKPGKGTVIDLEFELD